MITPGPKYVRYTGCPNKARGRAIHITINPHGVLHFSEKAYVEMGKPAAATLWYDEDNRKIAVMVRWGENGLAFRIAPIMAGGNDGKLYILQSALVSASDTR